MKKKKSHTAIADAAVRYFFGCPEGPWLAGVSVVIRRKNRRGGHDEVHVFVKSNPSLEKKLDAMSPEALKESMAKRFVRGCF